MVRIMRIQRKRRTRQHVIADLAVNHVERQALLCGFTAERMAHDYGIDLELATFNRRGEIEEGKILMQVKASERLRQNTLERPAMRKFARFRDRVITSKGVDS